jgi:hypothetical protein
MVLVDSAVGCACENITVLYDVDAQITSEEDSMATDEIIIRLFCMVDDQLGSVNKREDAHLYTSEIVTIGLLFALKGGRFRAFYRWLNKNYGAYFPKLPERSRLARRRYGASGR